MLVAAPLQMLLDVLIGAGGGLVVAGVFTLLLAAPVLMLTAVAPGVTVTAEGLRLHPVIWREQVVTWGQIKAVKDYPLLPTRDAEVNRRWMVGRGNYEPATGVMLVIPALPPQYRIAGFFAGERGQPIIALTNRAHTDYEALLAAVRAGVEQASFQ